MFQRMDGKFLMTFEHDQIMAVAFVISEKEVLAMDRIYLLPVFQGKLYRRKRRMGMEFILEGMLFQEEKHLVYSLVSCHLFRLLA
jgi:hypothetical protein